MTGIIASQSLLFSDADATDPWVTIFDADLVGTFQVGNNATLTGRNFRMRITADWPRPCLAECRITWQANPNGPGINAASCAAGRWGGVTGSGSDAYDGSQVAVTFDGGSPGFSIGAGEEKVSDPFTYPFADTDGMHFALFTDATSNLSVWDTNVNDYVGFIQTAGDTSIDSTMVTNPVLGTFGLTDVLYGLKKVEVNP